ncbi:MAG: substrate-binding domain-containing protein [Spirochaetes bacterium]|jgi:hypothetical protein|nr:substrate-binding domain-containing protein [Spirochaetota bacterium]
MSNYYDKTNQKNRTFINDVEGFYQIHLRRGAVENEAAEIRYRAYYETLQEHNLPFDENLIFHGDFKPEMGEKAIHHYFVENNYDIDAIVFANDEMAVRASCGADKHGINIPDDVAITGFDDTEQSRFLDSPLTTVHQPLYDMAYTGIELLIKSINNETVPLITEMLTYMITRYSCGCFLDKAASVTGNPAITYDSFPDTFEELRTSIIREIENSSDAGFLGTHVYSDQIQTLLDILQQTLKELPVKSDTFLRKFSDLLLHNITHSRDITVWQSILRIIRIHTTRLSKSTHSSHDTDELFYNAQVILGQFLLRQEGRQRRVMEDTIWQIRGFSDKINTVYSVELLMASIKDYLNTFGVQGIAICLYEEETENTDNDSWILPHYTTYGLVMQNGLFTNNETTQSHFKTRRFIHEDLIKREKPSSFMVKPLYNGKTHFGYIIFELFTTIEIFYEMIREQISITFKTISLFQKRMRRLFVHILISYCFL